MPKKYWYLSVFSGLLLCLPWYDVFPGVILCVALVPLLLAEQFIFEFKQHFSSQLVFLLAFVTFFTWNLLSLWWVIKISATALFLIVSLSSLFYAFTFWLFHVVKRLLGIQFGRIAFIVFWLALEFYSLHAEFSFPWLILGNGLANQTSFIQWYEYTGVLGGSLWILLMNTLVFEIFRRYKHRYFMGVKWLVCIASVLLVIPIVWSMLLNQQIKETGERCNIVIIQPNIDPFTEKFATLKPEDQVNRIIHLADSIKNNNIDYYVAPETAIDNDIWENALMNNYSLFMMRNFLSQHPNSTIFFGAITCLEYTNTCKKTATVRYDSSENRYFDVFNSAMQVDTSNEVQIYHKSKLVMGAEKVPFPSVFKFFDKYLVNLGGITGSLGEEKDRSVFKHVIQSYCPAPIICYESVFGEYVTDYVKKGANMLFVITNDGWWGGTMGYNQHLRYAQLRAIETRRSVARSANTGISAFINQKGEITKSTGWWQQTTLSGTICTNKTITFYVRYGDYIGRVAVLLTVCILIIGFGVSGVVRRIRRAFLL